MSLVEKLAQQRRIFMLQALAEDDARSMNDAGLGVVLKHLAHNTPRDLVRADMNWLAEQGLLSLARMPDGRGGELWIATLNNNGQEVAEGRSFPGVARPGLR